MGIAGYYSFLKAKYPAAIRTVRLIRRSEPQPKPKEVPAGAAPEEDPVPHLPHEPKEGDEPFHTTTVFSRLEDNAGACEPDPSYDHLYFDVNNFLYTAAVGYKPEISHVIKRLFGFIDSVLRTFPPKRTVFFSIDGPAPMAKFILQRRRRADKELKQEEDEFNTLQFTPGSEFMQRLKDSLIYMSVQRLSKRFPHIRFHISGADRMGEGELKIFEHIASMAKDDRCLVVGNDADLVLFAMRAGHTQVDILGLSGEGGLAGMRLISTSKLRDRLISTCPQVPERVLATDMTFISVLCGNDYLPKVRGFKLEWAWSQYIDARSKAMFPPTEPLYDDSNHQINIKFLSYILDPWAFLNVVKPRKLEEEKNPKSALNVMIQKYLEPAVALSVVKEETAVEGGYAVRWLIDGAVLAEGKASNLKDARNNLAMNAIGLSEGSIEPALDSPLYRLLSSRNSSLTQNEYMHTLKSYLPSGAVELDPTEETIQANVTEYIKGLLWVMRYLEGSCHDYTYRYIEPFAPSVSELCKYASSAPSTFTFNENTTPYVPLAFFFGLLPPNSESSLSFVPAEYRSLITDPKSPIHDLYNGHDAEALWRYEPEKCFQRVVKALESVPASHPLLQFSPTLIFERSRSSDAQHRQQKPAPSPFLLRRKPIDLKVNPLTPRDIERITCQIENSSLLSTALSKTTTTSSATMPHRPRMPLAFTREYCRLTSRPIPTVRHFASSSPRHRLLLSSSSSTAARPLARPYGFLPATSSSSSLPSTHSRCSVLPCSSWIRPAYRASLSQLHRVKPLL